MKYPASEKLIPLYAGVMFAAFVGFLLIMPILGGDTDTWFHLAMGRQISETMEIPSTPFFSFIEPKREGIDYFWLFQWLIYNIYRLGGKWGAGALAAFRALVYGLTVMFIYLCLRGRDNRLGERDNGLGRAASAALVLYMSALLLRGLIIRPHMMNYLLIVVFIYIIEEKPKAAPALPFLSVLWCNLHGIEYPVPVLITVSYLAGYALTRVRPGLGAATDASRRTAIPMLLSLTLSAAAVFLTPAGTRLLALPFNPTEYSAMYIAELSPPSVSELFTFFISPGEINPYTVNAAAVVTVMLCALTALTNKRATAAHVIMFAGGAFLLTKGMRFVNEFVLLGLPMVRAAAGGISPAPLNLLRSSMRVVLAALLMLMPPVYLRTAHRIFTGYPYAASYLPDGTIRFLAIYGGEGNILTDPTAAGYFIWKLHPRWKIFMRLDTTCFFGDEDYFFANNAFNDPEVLRKFIARYRPAFIAAPASNPAFGRLIKEHPRYVPVFLDDSGVLYADIDAGGRPDIDVGGRTALAGAFQIKSFDPYELLSAQYELPEGDRAGDVLVELNRLHSVYPSTVAVNRVIGALHNAAGRYAEGLAAGESIIAANDGLAAGYAIKGDALFGLKRYAEAAGSFQEALDRLREGDRPPLYKKLSLCHSKLGDLKNACRALKKAVNVFDPRVDYAALYTLALLAQNRGDEREAAMFYRFALEKVPPDKKQWVEAIKQKLAGLGAEIPE